MLQVQATDVIRTMASKPLGWLRTAITIPAIFVIQSVNWSDPALLLLLRSAFVLFVGLNGYLSWRAQGAIRERAESDEQYREAKVWVRQRQSPGFMSMIFGSTEEEENPRPKPSDFQETTEFTLEEEAASKALQGAVGSATLPLLMSILGGIHFMLAFQVVNAPFNLIDNVLARKYVLGDESASVLPNADDIVRSDPTVIPPALQLARRHLRIANRPGVPSEGAPVSEGLGGSRRTGLLASTAPHESETSSDAAAGAAPTEAREGPSEATLADATTYGEHYDEIMEDAIFSIFESDEPVNIRAVEALRESRKDLTYATDDHGWTLLMVACANRATPQRAIERMVELGAGPVGARDRDGWTCLHWAAHHECPQAVRGIATAVLRGGPSSASAGSVASRKSGGAMALLLSQRAADGRTAAQVAADAGSNLARAALDEAAGLAATLTGGEPVDSSSVAAAARADAELPAVAAAPRRRPVPAATTAGDDIGEID